MAYFTPFRYRELVELTYLVAILGICATILTAIYLGPWAWAAGGITAASVLTSVLILRRVRDEEAADALAGD